MNDEELLGYDEWTLVRNSDELAQYKKSFDCWYRSLDFEDQLPAFYRHPYSGCQWQSVERLGAEDLAAMQELLINSV